MLDVGIPKESENYIEKKIYKYIKTIKKVSQQCRKALRILSCIISKGYSVLQMPSTALDLEACEP